MATPAMTDVKIGNAEYQIPSGIIDSRQFYISVYITEPSQPGGTDKANFHSCRKYHLPANLDMSYNYGSHLSAILTERLDKELADLSPPDTETQNCIVILHEMPIRSASFGGNTADDMELKTLAENVDNGTFGLIMAPAELVSKAVQGNEESSNRFRQGENYKNIGHTGNSDSATLTSSDVATATE